MSHLGRSATLMYNTKEFLAGRLVLLFTHSVYPVDLCQEDQGQQRHPVVELIAAVLLTEAGSA